MKRAKPASLALFLPLNLFKRGLALALGLVIAVATRQSAALEPVPYPVQVTAPEDQPGAPRSELEGSPPPVPAEEKLATPPQAPIKKPRPISQVPLVSTNAPPPLIWKWPTFSTADYVLTAVGAATTLATAIISPRPQHSLTGPIGFDEEVRSELRADKLSVRYMFRDASDVGLSLTVTWPFVSDALTTAWWYRGSREAAQEMALIDLEALSVIGAIQGVSNVVVSRERPFGQDCGQGELPDDAIDCVHSVHYRSFFSGHSAFSFTGAALICVHHFENELMGGPWDAVSCAGGYAIAATTATFRVVADMHYASDVLLGATLGTLVGYSVPLLHYRKLGGGSRAIKSGSNLPSLELRLTPAPGGLGVMGTF